jgi:hypothetical protein
VTYKSESETETTESFLERDHASLGQLFAELQSALKQGSPRRSFDLLDLIWARLGIHIRAEHLCLFPALLGAPLRNPEARDGDAPDMEKVQEAVSQLRSDHDFFMHELASAVNALRRLKDSDDFERRELEAVRAKVDAVCARLEEHNQTEEEKVYRWIGTVLDEEEQAELRGRVGREFEKQPPRFHGRDMYSDA